MEKIFNFKITPIVLAIFVILLSVGYSAFQESMNITGSVLDVRVEADIRITGISVDSSTGNAISTYEEYNVKNISMGVTLPSSNSTVTYKIEVTNFGNVPMAIASINGLPYNLEYEIIDYNLKDKICDINDKCTLGAKKEFYLKIKNKADQFNSSYTTHLLNLSFEFKPFYTVTYKNINNVHYPTSVLEGEDLNVTFDSETTIKEIKMGNNILSSNNYTFDGINLTVPNVNGDIVIDLPPTLISLLLKQYSPSNEKGLLKDSTNPNLYYYTGTNEEVANNFLWYGGHQWRVLEFDTSENSVTLITQQPLTAIYPARAIWTTQSTYESSYINKWLNDYFYNSLDSSIQSNIQKTTFNVGIYTNIDEFKTTQKVGLLDETQYLRAGDGTSAVDSYLDIKDYFWLGNRYSSSSARYVYNNGTIISGSVSSSYGVRAVIKISDLTIARGDGTLSSNYQVGNKSTNTNNVQVGEYINVPYSGGDNACGSDNMCAFRVVSKDDDSIKVVLNGLLPTTSAWANNAYDNINKTDLIYTNVLNAFISNIDSKYITTGTYGVGMYAGGNNYTVPQGTKITANVGLPTIGEMFSGNDIDMGSTKTFVDANTIENPSGAIQYWSMNRSSSYFVRSVSNVGSLNDSRVSDSRGVRPVIYLKNDVDFISGEGTAQSPYELPKSLINTLLEQYNESNTTGLVKDSTNENLYYYTGTNEQVSNNFLWYGGHQWRVLEFDTSAKTLTLITQQPLTAIQPASAVWTTQSAYESSYINQWLNDYFYNSLDSSIQSNIQKTTFNIGIYTDVDKITTTQKVGLLDEEQYKRAGDGTTGKDSFLDIKDSFWLGNRYSSSSVRNVGGNGNLGSGSQSLSSCVRAVIKISDITITGGEGTLASNYQVGNKATNTNNVQIGEYINVPYKGTDNVCGSDNKCIFRVVSKNSNSIKVVLNGLLPTTSKWANSASDNMTTSDLIYTNVLNGFIGNIDSKYITTGTYGVGMYESGNNYTVPQNTTITANIGLPTVGEMFSGNDIDLSTSSTKTFVGVNTIENPTISNNYWTMNRYSSSSVRYVSSNGNMSNFSPSFSSGVRPVIYLKNNLELTGEGTAQSPYEIVPPTPPKSVSFAEDSWETIHKIVEMGLASEYYNVGDEKEVILAGYTNGSESTFTVRIANIETPAECATEGFSQTACGFVVEFVDIITEHGMNLENTSMGGWPSSEMRRFVNSDIYNALPKELRDIIIETNVVSGYDAEDYATLNSTDKIYLLALEEITLFDDTTLKNKKTKMLKFYQNFYDRCYVADPYGECNVSPALKNYHGNGSMWWLRTAYVNSDSTFQMIFEEGEYSLFIIPATVKSGVAPAFRIG